jgi:hypothetical protein
LEFRAVDTWLSAVAADTTGSKTGAALRLSRQVPDPGKMYKLRLRAKNIGTPATSTVATIYRSLVMDVQELTAEITSGRGDNVAGKGVGVVVTNAVSITGTPTFQGLNANNVAVSGNPVSNGARAQNAQGTANTVNGSSVHQQADMAGRLVVKPGSIPQSQLAGKVNITAVTETTVHAGTASNRVELSEITIANRDTIAHTIDIRDAAAGTVRKTYLVAAGATQQFTFPWGFSAATLGAAVTAQLREAATTAVEISTTAHLTTA